MLGFLAIGGSLKIFKTDFEDLFPCRERFGSLFAFPVLCVPCRAFPPHLIFVRMRFSFLSLSFAFVAALFFSSCATSSFSFLPSGSTHFTPAAPSAQVLAVAQSKPKDRHQMPVYRFGERNRLVRTTAYTCSESDHLQYGSANAIGSTLKYNSRVRSAAADWSFYPLGTVFKIKGHSQLYVVDDYGSALTGTGTIDLYHPSRDMMNLWGRRNVEIVVLRWGSLDKSAEVLSKRTRYPHCRKMHANIQRMRGAVAATAMR